MGRGGGNDGGVIATKRYLIKTNDGEKRKTEASEEVRASRFTTCSLSGEPLGDHIVVDLLGNLFNKEAIIAMLLERRVVPEFAHIKSLKHVLPVVATRVKASAAGESSSATVVLSVKPLFVCPISGLEATGRYSFVVMRKCGCLVSERAVRELSSASSTSSSSSGAGAGAAAAAGGAAAPAAETCAACGQPRIPGEAGLVKVAPTEEEADVIRARLAADAAAGKAAKGEGKGSKGKAAGAGAEASGPASSAGGGTGEGAASHAGAKRPRQVDAEETGAGAAASGSASGASHHGHGSGSGSSKAAHVDTGASSGHVGQAHAHGRTHAGGAGSAEAARGRPVGSGAQPPPHAAAVANGSYGSNAAAVHRATASVAGAIAGSVPVSAAVNASVTAAMQTSKTFAGLFHQGGSGAAPSKGLGGASGFR